MKNNEKQTEEEKVGLAKIAKLLHKWIPIVQNPEVQEEMTHYKGIIDKRWEERKGESNFCNAKKKIG